MFVVGQRIGYRIAVPIPGRQELPENNGSPFFTLAHMAAQLIGIAEGSLMNRLPGLG